MTAPLLAMLFIATVLAGRVLAESPFHLNRTMASSNRAAVESMFNAWMAGDSSAFPLLLSDDIEWTITGNSLAAGTTRGRTELMAKVLGPFGARFVHSGDGFRPRHIHGVYADGDTVVVHFDAAGTANDGKPYSNSYVWLLTMNNGKIVRATAFFDSIAFDDFWRRVQPAQN
ncbi:nuclear transport factor 2 family protein [Paraburkholderia solisilvae]|nr:nuclear transport factor 2 family protein [Paraburkholderia solisilvae]